MSWLKNTGTDVVLGPIDKRAVVTLDNGVPAEQAISRQRLRPGSGFLEVKVTTDGPTRVLQIKDQAHKVGFVTDGNLEQLSN